MLPNHHPHELVACVANLSSLISIGLASFMFVGVSPLFTVLVKAYHLCFVPSLYRVSSVHRVSHLCSASHDVQFFHA